MRANGNKTVSPKTFHKLFIAFIPFLFQYRILIGILVDTELTPAIVNRLIQRIEVHKSEKIDGRKRVHLDVYFTAVGLINIPDEKELFEMMQEIQSAKSA